MGSNAAVWAGLGIVLLSLNGFLHMWRISDLEKKVEQLEDDVYEDED